MSEIEKTENPHDRIAKYKQLVERIIPNVVIMEKMIENLLKISKIQDIFDISYLSGILNLIDSILNWFEFFDMDEKLEKLLLKIMGKLLTNGIDFVREFDSIPYFYKNLKNVICIIHRLDENFDGKFQFGTNFKNLSLEFNKENNGLNEFKIYFKNKPTISVINLLILNDNIILNNTKFNIKYFKFFSFDYELINENEMRFKGKVEGKIIINKSIRKKINFNENYKHNLNCEEFNGNLIESDYYSCNEVKSNQNLYVTFDLSEGTGHSISYVNFFTSVFFFFYKK